MSKLEYVISLKKIYSRHLHLLSNLMKSMEDPLEHDEFLMDKIIETTLIIQKLRDNAWKEMKIKPI